MTWLRLFLRWLYDRLIYPFTAGNDTPADGQDKKQS